jgi:rubrerythrin
MANESVLAAIKTGMRAELDGVTTYESAADRATGSADQDVRDFFLDLAGEEMKHYNWLLSYFKELSEGRIPEKDLSEGSEPAIRGIFSADFLRRIGENRYISTAISTALLLEANSVRHYLERAEESIYPALKAFYERLAAWEDKHYHDLLSIQEESERYFWSANRWEPF